MTPAKDMDDEFDRIPAPYRTERLARMRDLIVRIKADYGHYAMLKKKLEADNRKEQDIEDMSRIAAWLKRDITAYKKLSTMSIEGVSCAEFDDISDLPGLKI